MRIYVLDHANGVIVYIAANTAIQALQVWCKHYNCGIEGLYFEDQIYELSESEWPKYSIEDDTEESFLDLMNKNIEPHIIGDNQEDLYLYHKNN